MRNMIGCSFIIGCICGIVFTGLLQRGLVGFYDFSSIGRYILTKPGSMNFNVRRILISKKLNDTHMDLLAGSELFIKYFNEYSTVQGWVNPEVFYPLWLLVKFQYEELNMVDGAIGEIGVHRGKLTSYLYLLRHRQAKQKLFAVDAFSKKELNTDKSGDGDRKLFLEVIQKFANVSPHEVRIFEGNSLDLNPHFSNNSNAQQWWATNVVDTTGCQLVSIDGGHTTLLTYSDLCVISNCLIDGGIIIIDDIKHPEWLGVIDGVERFLSDTSKFYDVSDDPYLKHSVTVYSNSPNFNFSQDIIKSTEKSRNGQEKCLRLVPILMYYNKLFVTTPNYYPIYMRLLQTLNADNNRLVYYNALRSTMGNIPIWMDNRNGNRIFDKIIKPILIKQLQKAS